MELSGEKEMHRGDWRVWSDVDPRWEATGNNSDSQEAQREGQLALQSLKEKLGDPPEDILWMHKVN